MELMRNENVRRQRMLEEIIVDCGINRLLGEIANEAVDLICDKFAGQKITRRIQTAVKKILPDDMLTFYEHNRQGSYCLQIWGGLIPYDRRLRLLLGHGEAPYDSVRPDKLRDFSRRYTVEIGRAARIKEEIDNGTFSRLWERAQAVEGARKALEKDCGDDFRCYFSRYWMCGSEEG